MEIKEDDISVKLQNFLAGLPIKKLHETISSNVEGKCIVVAWIDSLLEGVEMFYNNESSKTDPRFKMKLKVTHGDSEAAFCLSDKDVEKLAVRTCPLLLSMEESCSIHPYEVEYFYGDPILCQIEKRNTEDFKNLPCFKVISFTNDRDLLEMFFDFHMTTPIISLVEESSGNQISFQSSDDSSENNSCKITPLNKAYEDDKTSSIACNSSFVCEAQPMSDGKDPFSNYTSAENESSLTMKFTSPNKESTGVKRKLRSPTTSSFQLRKKNKHTGMCSYVEKILSTGPKNSVRRKLDFDNEDANTININHPTKK